MDFLHTVPHKGIFQTHCENCTGNKLIHCSNTIGFEDYESQDCHYIYHSTHLKNCRDVTNTGRSELCYETLVSNDALRSLCTNECRNTSNSYHCQHCFSCDHLFGCVGLRNKSYCILNKQYSSQEYETLVAQIIKNMISDPAKDGAGCSRGEFFPSHMSPF